MKVDGVSIIARGITATGPLGPVFANVDADIHPGDLATVTGPSGTGRTSLLLALSGRMRTTSGYLEVSGLRLPKEAKHVRRLIAPARVRPGFELEPSFLVREAVRERRITSRIAVEDVEDAFSLVGIDPDPDATVRELHPGERVLLAVALTMAAAPSGILVDDVDAGLPHAARTRVWAALEAVTGVGTTVLAVSPDPPRFDQRSRMIRLAPTPGPGEQDTATVRSAAGQPGAARTDTTSEEPTSGSTTSTLTFPEPLVPPSTPDESAPDASGPEESRSDAAEPDTSQPDEPEDGR